MPEHLTRQKVASLYYTHKPGGMCKRLYRLFFALSDKRIEVHYLTLDPPPFEDRQNITIQLIPFPIASRKGYFFWLIFGLWAPLYFFWYCRKNQLRHFVLFNPTYALLTLPAKYLLKGHQLLFVRGFIFKAQESQQASNWSRVFQEKIELLGVRTSDRVVFMSNAMLTAFLQYYRTSIPPHTILPNDLPSREHTSTSSRNSHKFIVLTCGVLTKGKNISLVFEAMRLLPSTLRERMTLFVAGTGPQKTTLQNLSKDLSGVEFLGWVDDMHPLFQQANLYIHPSLHEGIPNSVLEALSFELPILLSDIPEHREITQIPEMLFDPSSAGELAKRIQHASENLEDLQKKSAQSAAHFRFSWEERAQDTVETWLKAQE